MLTNKQTIDIKNLLKKDGISEEQMLLLIEKIITFTSIGYKEFKKKSLKVDI